MHGFGFWRDGTVCAGVLALGLAPAWAQVAEPAPVQLRCDVSYAGTSRSLQATPVADPYSVPSEDIRGRFRFKAVVVGTPAQVEYISLYAYQNTGPQAVLLHQAKYQPPFVWPADGSPLGLTGQQHLYAGPMERELIYQCSLHRGRP
jgi:hypothetical protein